MKYLVLIAAIIMMVSACHNHPSSDKNYPRMIGDIAYDASIDTEDVQLCNDEDIAVQYYVYTNIEDKYPYVNDKDAVIKIFEDHYNASEASKESGLIRIRFLVNCHGELHSK